MTAARGLSRIAPLAGALVLASASALAGTEIVRQPGRGNAARINQSDGRGFVAVVVQPGAGNVARVHQGAERRPSRIAFDLPPGIAATTPASCDVVTGSPCRRQIVAPLEPVPIGHVPGVAGTARRLGLADGTPERTSAVFLSHERGHDAGAFWQRDVGEEKADAFLM